MLRHCDLCGHPATVYLRQDERIAICQHCGFLFVSERRTPEVIAKEWDVVWGDGYDPEWPGVKARLYYVAEWLHGRLGLSGRSLLDIGAGRGIFMKMAEDRGAICTGLEPCEANATRRPGIIPGTVENTVIAGRFDIVTILWTLENCGDCIGMLNFARNHLAPGGHVVVATGSRILVPFRKPLYEYLPKPEATDDLHCFRFSANSLERAMENAGLDMFVHNDFRQNDVLLGVGRQDDGGTKQEACDDPDEVQDFFSEWERMFP